MFTREVVVEMEYPDTRTVVIALYTYAPDFERTVLLELVKRLLAQNLVVRVERCYVAPRAD